MSFYEAGNFRTGSSPSRRHVGLSCYPKLICWGWGQAHSKASDSLLLILKWDRPMVCLTILGVTVLIFHRSSFLCSQGSFSTEESGEWRRAGESWWEEKQMAYYSTFPGRQVTIILFQISSKAHTWGRERVAQEWGTQKGGEVERGRKTVLEGKTKHEFIGLRRVSSRMNKKKVPISDWWTQWGTKHRDNHSRKPPPNFCHLLPTLLAFFSSGRFWAQTHWLGLPLSSRVPK